MKRNLIEIIEHTRLKNACAIIDPQYIVSHAIAAVDWHQLEDVRCLAECETLSDYHFFLRFQPVPYRTLELFS